MLRRLASLVGGGAAALVIGLFAALPGSAIAMRRTAGVGAYDGHFIASADGNSPPVVRMGVLVGAIKRVGGDPFGAVDAGVVRVFDLGGRLAARHRVPAGHRFRFVLAAGSYKLKFSSVLHGVRDCPPEVIVIRAAHTTHTNAPMGCYEY